MPNLSGDQIASLTYLMLLGVVLGGYFLISNRQNMGKMAQQAALWLFIFLGAIVAVGLWMDIRDDLDPPQTVTQAGVIEVPRSPDGHYYLTLEINDTPVRFVVDTGATEMVLTQEDAARIGIDTNTLLYSGTAQTANGTVEIAPVRLERVALGGVVDEGVRALVNSGELFESLLGMGYLNRFDRLEISDGRLVLER
ncbi:MAG: TIGR02281 family clan AA aspartic protease [Pseudomonadota bacterium]